MLSAYSLFSPPMNPWQPLFFFFVMGLPVLNISYKWNHSINNLLCMASSIQHILKFHSYCNIYQYFVPFCGNILFHRLTMFCLFLDCQNLGYFYLLSIVNSVAMDIHVQLLFECLVPIILDIYLGVELVSNIVLVIIYLI